ncbi:type III pantothenate kinase [Congregibacter litoralis]|uniref:Type III pantothenate kinase n=1 Tax=Congregibacter litoralis KT71 TaxID=314285 RepID=A4A6B5_9GAMM|nr:type III pantothenate kinase [Congregibacter litoralis]EAQ98562.1 pantothenate kinase [Congregibacter litoralis KT71]
MTGALILLDIGNSGAKWLRIDEGKISGAGRLDTAQIPKTLGPSLQNAKVLIASVAAPELQQELSEKLSAQGAVVWFAQTRDSLDGLVNSYADPERMGVDRWLAMLAARRRHSGYLCVVDAGSALTIDLVAPGGEHEGGYIIPGTALMERALFADTRRVRDRVAGAVSLLPGRSTAEAVSHGLLLAQAGAVDLALKRASQRGETPRLLLCGGGAEQLAEALSCEYTLAPRLVFEGLLRQAEVECAEMLALHGVSSALLF